MSDKIKLLRAIATPGTKFDLGQVVATPGALSALVDSNESSFALLLRHQTGDWGDLNASDKQQNEDALVERDGYYGRIFSAYILNTGTKIWIITEADRSSTCILLPDEY